MSSAPFIVVGAGGHAVVVADALLSAGERVLGFTDADASRHGQLICGLPVLGGDIVLTNHSPESVLLANGIGGGGEPSAAAVRRGVQQRLEAEGWRFGAVRHPTAVVSRFARLGKATQLFATSVVQAGAEIGTGCIVNTAAIVEHDVTIGAWTHVAPRSVVCGSVRIGERCHIGAGAVVRQGLEIASDTVLGAGAVLVKSCLNGGMFIGMPARSVNRKCPGRAEAESSK